METRNHINHSHNDLLNTNRDDQAEDSQQNLITNQMEVTSIARNRPQNIDMFDSALEMANDSARDMPLSYNRQFDRRGTHVSQNHTDQDDIRRMTTSQNRENLQLQTDLGIMSFRDGTNNTPANTTNMGDRSVLGRENTQSRTDSTNRQNFEFGDRSSSRLDKPGTLPFYFQIYGNYEFRQKLTKR